MEEIDRIAKEYVISLGSELRKLSFSDLQNLPIGNISQPMSLDGSPYTFVIRRDRRSNGALRIIIEANRPMFFNVGHEGSRDSFDMLPSG